MNNQPDFESTLRERLDELKPVSARNPQAAARGRARFLAQARTANETQRNRGWGLIFRKQQFAMNLVVTILVIVGLFAGAGTTVRAAQNDLPNQPLYGVKLLSEDVSLQLQRSPEAKVNRLLELSQTRIEEMSRLIAAGQTPPEQVRLRLEQHLQQTLQLCSNMDETALSQELPQLSEQLQSYENEIQGLQSHAGQSAKLILDHTQVMLQTQLSVVDNGLANHAQFRNTVRNGFHYGQTETPPSVAVPSKAFTPNGKLNGQTTPQPGNSGSNGEELHPSPEPGGPHPHMTPIPKGQDNSTNPGNNSGGNNNNNNKDKNKTPKDNGGSSSNGNGSNGNGNGNSNGNGNGSGGGNPNK